MRHLADPSSPSALAMHDTADRALSTIPKRYADYGPTLAHEKLYECHDMRLAKETVRRLMTDAGPWVPHRLRPMRSAHPVT